ncbi:hypothetical protein QVD17_10047 [Tagetes erecta]|uniref:Uncharacterized protein n=1 Tax=Tagetes erecta TaxID=13708 RepID=A0AAD8P5Y5_TARER|nr:hypothetical protein QVD17_10047 [Tagetes erecta]
MADDQRLLLLVSVDFNDLGWGLSGLFRDENRDDAWVVDVAMDQLDLHSHGFDFIVIDQRFWTVFISQTARFSLCVGADNEIIPSLSPTKFPDIFSFFNSIFLFYKSSPISLISLSFIDHNSDDCYKSDGDGPRRTTVVVCSS